MPNQESQSQLSDMQPMAASAGRPEKFDPFDEPPAKTLVEILVDALLIIAPKRRFICSLTLAGAALSVVIAIRTPDTFTASAVVMPPQQQQSTAAALLGQLGPLAGPAGNAIGMKGPGDLYVGILGSRTITDDLIEQFRLKQVYAVKTTTAARANLKARTRLSSAMNSLIKIEVQDRDPIRAAALANAYIVELNKQNSRLAATDAGQRRRFLESRLNEEKTALASAEDAMKRTQQQTGVIQLDAQANLTIASVARTKAQIAAEEVALQRLEMGATDLNPEVVRLKTELTALRSQLARLQSSPEHRAGDPLVSTSRLPESGFQYVRSLRELKYHEYLFEMLSKQYEVARFDESKAAPAIQVVDRAIPPEKKSGPRRSMIVLFGVLGSFGLAITWTYFSHSIRTPRHISKLQMLKSQVWP